MSKLPNAPLLEVIFELRWQITNNTDLVKSQYLHGDLFSILKNDYPDRESLAPPEIPQEVFINKPMYRFRKSKGEYPVYQVGPGLIAINCNNEVYYWEHYFELAKKLTESFFSVFEHKDEKFRPSFLYIDFFLINIEKDSIIEFINSKLNISVNQNFYNSNSSNPKAFNLALTYETELGSLSISLQSGKNGKGETGLVLQTRIDGIQKSQGPEEIMSWLSRAHDFCSDLFKELTKGELYESFKN